jgi:DNA-binding MarR family transcriptional regulator
MTVQATDTGQLVPVSWPFVDEQRDVVDELTTALRGETPELDDPRTALARRVMRLASRLDDVVAECLAPWGLTKTDYGVLVTLLAAGKPYRMRPTDLRARLLITSGGASGVLNRLERAELIERRPDASDGRGSLVQLTEAGVAAATASLRAWTLAQQDLLRNVPDEMADAAADALRDILLALGDEERRTSAAPARRRR